MRQVGLGFLFAGGFISVAWFGVGLVANRSDCQLHAFVADIGAAACDQGIDLRCGLAAKRARRRWRRVPQQALKVCDEFALEALKVRDQFALAAPAC